MHLLYSYFPPTFFILISKQGGGGVSAHPKLFSCNNTFFAVDPLFTRYWLSSLTVSRSPQKRPPHRHLVDRKLIREENASGNESSNRQDGS